MKTKAMVETALLVALMCVGALITVPLPFTPVPITLQTLVIMFAALYLPKKQCLTGIIVYILIGIAGLPVFSGGRSGLGVLFGPTGGFMMAFPLMAFSIAVVFDILKAKTSIYAAAVAAVVAGNIPLFVCGSVWFALIQSVSPLNAFLMCVLPYLPGDAVKAVAAVSTYSSVNAAVRVRRR